jgi:hypothetical protein
MSSCGQPRIPNPLPGETTQPCLPPGVIAGRPLPYQASSVVQVIAGQNYNSSQYTRAFADGNFYNSVTLQNQAAGRTSPQFKSQADRLRYLQGRLLQGPCPVTDVTN